MIKKMKQNAKMCLIVVAIAIIAIIAVFMMYVTVDKNVSLNDNEASFEHGLTAEQRESLEQNLTPEQEPTTEQKATPEQKSVPGWKASPEHIKNKFKINFSQWNKTCDWNLVVINSQNPIPKNYELNLKDCRGVKVDARISEPLNDMIEDAYKQGIKLWISSGYRTLEKQEQLFSRKLQDYINKGYSKADAENLAEQVVARPGTSEHNIGIAVDLNGVRDDFYTTKEYKWLIENAQNYGFILRYDDKKQGITGKIYEPWHFRYVGEYVAKQMKEKNMCLEEYIAHNFN